MQTLKHVMHVEIDSVRGDAAMLRRTAESVTALVTSMTKKEEEKRSAFEAGLKERLDRADREMKLDIASYRAKTEERLETFEPMVGVWGGGAYFVDY